MRNSQIRRVWLLALVLGVFSAGCGRQQVTPDPALTAINPNSGLQGQTLAVTLTGSNFAPGSTISLSGTGITVTGTSVVSSTQINATFAIAATAPVGAQKVTVTSQGRVSNSVTFTVNTGLALTSIVPNSRPQGQTVSVTLTGTNFAAGATIGFSGTGIAATNIVVVSSTQITATFTIAPNATIGPQNVTVTSQGRTSNAVPFTVNAGTPTLTSIVPNSGFQGQTVPVTLNGTNFTPGSTIGFSGTGVTAGPVTFVGPTQITANFTIAMGAPLGPQNVTVITPVGTSNPLPFTVNLLAPTVIATNPVNGATNVPINNKITAAFNKPMNPATINAATFLVTAVAPVAGPIGNLSIAYDPINNVAIFTPAANLPPNNTFTATVTSGAMDTAGNPLVLTPPGPGPGLPQAPNPWKFTTGSTDFTQPVIVSTNPANGATGVPLNQVITATFSKPMDPSSINPTNFTLFQGATQIAGTVSYVGTTASFAPTNPLSTNLTYTARILGGLTGARDLGGNQLASGPAPNPWTFTTGPPFNTPPNRLGTASTYGGFGGAAGMTNQGILTVINGNIGTTGASTLITGFHDTTLPGTPAPCRYTETPLNVGTVNGVINTAPPPPTVACPNEGTLATAALANQALVDATTAYNGLTPASIPGGTDPGAGQLGGLVLAPGVYQAAAGTFMITGSDLTLDAQGDPNAVWIFQMAASLTVGAPAAPRSVILVNGAQAKNVFWQVGSAATINAAGGGTFVGTVISQAGISFSTAGNVAIVTLNGRALTLTGPVTMVNTVINVPAP